MIEKKYFIAILIGIIILVLLILAFQVKIQKSPGECEKVLESNGSIDIVFLLDNADKNLMQDYAEFLINSQPYNQVNQKFNFYFAGTTSCKTVQGNVLLCYSSETLQTASNCKDDFIVVLSSSGNLRSSAYGNLISLNINQPKSVFLHEFGHAFGNLADEYVPSEIPSGSKNCQKSCNFLIEEGCFEGCSKSNYFRSIDSSIMRTLSTNNYGKLNTQIIKNAIQKY